MEAHCLTALFVHNCWWWPVNLHEERISMATQEMHAACEQLYVWSEQQHHHKFICSFVCFTQTNQSISSPFCCSCVCMCDGFTRSICQFTPSVMFQILEVIRSPPLLSVWAGLSLSGAARCAHIKMTQRSLLGIHKETETRVQSHACGSSWLPLKARKQSYWMDVKFNISCQAKYQVAQSCIETVFI